MGSAYRDALHKVCGRRRELGKNDFFLKISWTKQHLSDIRPQALYMNQLSKATANMSGFLGCSSEILVSHWDFNQHNVSEVHSHVKFGFFFSKDLWGPAEMLSCHMWFDFLKCWNRKVDDIYVSKKGLITQFSEVFNVHWKLRWVKLRYALKSPSYSIKCMMQQLETANSWSMVY